MKDKNVFVYWLIATLLAALFASNVLIYDEHQVQMERIEARHAVYEEHAQQMQELHAKEYRVITGARDGYHADAYDSSIDRIAEQQLLAAEYQLLLLQIIARQNAEMIELMIMRP